MWGCRFCFTVMFEVFDCSYFEVDASGGVEHERMGMECGCGVREGKGDLSPAFYSGVRI